MTTKQLVSRLYSEVKVPFGDKQEVIKAQTSLLGLINLEMATACYYHATKKVYVIKEDQMTLFIYLHELAHAMHWRIGRADEVLASERELVADLAVVLVFKHFGWLDKIKDEHVKVRIKEQVKFKKQIELGLVTIGVEDDIENISASMITVIERIMTA